MIKKNSKSPTSDPPKFAFSEVRSFRNFKARTKDKAITLQCFYKNK